MLSGKEASMDLGKRWEVVMDILAALEGYYAAPSGRARRGKGKLLEGAAALYQAFGALGSAAFSGELPPKEVADVLEGGEPPEAWPPAEKRAAKEYRKALARLDPDVAAVWLALFQAFALDARSAEGEVELWGFFFFRRGRDGFVWLGGTRRGDPAFQREVEDLVLERAPEGMLPTADDLIQVEVAGGKVSLLRYAFREEVTLER